MSRKIATSLLLLASSSLAIAQQTTKVPAWLAPPNVAASVVGCAAQATTYALNCTSDCTAIQKGQGTLVNGPSTVAFTQVWSDDGAAAEKTLIYDCVITKADGEADCLVKAGMEGTTGTLKKTTTLKEDEDILVTAGFDKSCIAIATTTSSEVESTTKSKTATPTPTPNPTLISTTSALNTTSSTPTLSGFSNSTYSSINSSSTDFDAEITTTRANVIRPTGPNVPAPAQSSSAANPMAVIGFEKVSGMLVAGLFGGFWGML